MRRITVELDESEREALATLARKEERDLRRQARLVIRQELQRRGLLSASHPEGAGDLPTPFYPQPTGKPRTAAKS